MVGSPTRTNSLPHRIERAQLGTAKKKTIPVSAVRLSRFAPLAFIPLESLVNTGYHLHYE
jgi:hypothetical protein